MGLRCPHAQQAPTGHLCLPHPTVPHSPQRGLSLLTLSTVFLAQFVHLLSCRMASIATVGGPGAKQPQPGSHSAHPKVKAQAACTVDPAHEPPQATVSHHEPLQATASHQKPHPISRAFCTHVLWGVHLAHRCK